MWGQVAHNSKDPKDAVSAKPGDTFPHTEVRQGKVKTPNAPKASPLSQANAVVHCAALGKLHRIWSFVANQCTAAMRDPKILTKCPKKNPHALAARGQVPKATSQRLWTQDNVTRVPISKERGVGQQKKEPQKRTPCLWPSVGQKQLRGHNAGVIRLQQGVRLVRLVDVAGPVIVGPPRLPLLALRVPHAWASEAEVPVTG